MKILKGAICMALTNEELRDHIHLMRYQLKVLEACNYKASMDYKIIKRSVAIIEELLKERENNA